MTVLEKSVYTVKKVRQYLLYINEENGKVYYALDMSANEAKMQLYPYSWSCFLKNYINVSGKYSFEQLRRKIYNDSVVFKKEYATFI